MCQVPAYASVTQGPKYDWINWCFDKLFWLSQGSQYARSKFQSFEYASGCKCQGSEYDKAMNMQGLQRVLNIPE